MTSTEDPHVNIAERTVTEMDETSPLLAAALRYAAAGIAVFPTHIGVRGDGKKDVRPAGPWKDISTTDESTIRAWWGQGSMYEGWAVTIDAGKSGIVGVDQDVSDGKNGIVEWEKLSPTPTARVRTGSGGAHDYYRANPERPVSVDNRGNVADGVDIRGDGGFLFAPPSIDPRGGSWEWIGGEPDWAALPPVPTVVLDRMEAAAARKRAKPASAPAPALEVEFSSGLSSLFAPEPALEEEAPTFTGSGLSSLFDGGRPADFGPDGGWKTRADAEALLAREHAAFLELTTEGSGRSHLLSQQFGVLAGHGVGVFWTYEQALDILLQACEENGFVDVHGWKYAHEQAARGLEFGMREPWHERPAPVTYEQAAAAVTETALSRMMGEMLSLEAMEEKEPPKFMIHKWLQFDSESWIAGAPGSKKSFIVFDMAARVIRGEPWMGHRTNPADVVMIVGEGSSGVGKRARAWRKRFGAVERDGQRHFYTLPRPVQATDNEDWAVLVAACTEIGEKAKAAGRGLMVILDTQARMTAELDENGNGGEGMGKFTRQVARIREATGACVLTVHHTTKTGETLRGASVINGAATTILTVSVDRKNKLAGTLSAVKQKDVDEAEDLKLGFEVVDLGLDPDGEALSSLVLAEDGSAAFKAAWAEVMEENADYAREQGERQENPFIGRQTVEDWIGQRTKSTLQHWVVQALWDMAQERGMTQAETRAAVAERMGGPIAKGTWSGAWQKVTDSCGQWADVVRQVPGSDRYTVDRLADGA